MLKQIFYPSWKSAIFKIIGGISLFFLVTVIQVFISFFRADYWSTGFPLSFEKHWGPCKPGDVCSKTSLSTLIFDIILWYFLFSLLSYWLNNLRKKQKTNTKQLS